MRLYRALGVALVVMCAIGTAAASTWAAEPTFSLLPEEKSEEVKVETQATTNVTFETVGGSKISCSLFHLKTTWFLFIIQITNHEENDTCKESAKNSCKTGTEASGIIAYTTEKGKPVFTSLSPLKVGFLFTIPETTIACGTEKEPEKLKIKLRGTMLEAYNSAFSTDLTTFSSNLRATKGKPELIKYFGGKEGKEELKAKLEMNFGLGFEEAGLNVEKELEEKAAKMVIVTG